MKIGICSMDTAKYPLYKEIGFDYVEANLSIVATISDEEFETYRKAVENVGIPVLRTNGFYPGGFKIVGANADRKKIEEYAKKALYRASKLGVKGCVFGSGRQRATEEGGSHDESYQDFIEVCRMMADEAKQYGIKIIIEPLNAEETDVVQTVADGLKAVADSKRDNVVTLADFYHVFRTGETLDAIENNGGALQHLHIARANMDRKYPHTDEDKAQCKVWADALKKAGYDETISLEGGLPEGEVEEVLRNVFELMQIFA